MLFLEPILYCLTVNLQCSCFLACCRDVEPRETFAASSYLIRYEKSFPCMNSHIGESSCHMPNSLANCPNRPCKMGLRFDDTHAALQTSESLEIPHPAKT